MAPVWSKLVSCCLGFRKTPREGTESDEDAGTALIATSTEDSEELLMDVEREHQAVFRTMTNTVLYVAPIENPGSVLCAGSGTMAWAESMAHIFPESKVTNVDIDQIPQYTRPGGDSLVRVALGEYAWGEPYDYVFFRAIGGAELAPGFYRNLRECVKDGGWVEIVDVHSNSAVCMCQLGQDWVTTDTCACCATGLTIKNRRAHLQKAGFDAIKTTYPLASWPTKDGTPVSLTIMTARAAGIMARPIPRARAIPFGNISRSV